jgi:hypothetical protein
MPRDITHIILADETAETIRRKDILNHPDAFHMGCVADDTFLYTASPKLSSKLHGAFNVDTRIMVLEMMDELQKEKNPERAAEKKAFICGYLCHMVADVTFHPLIYSISGSQLQNRDLSRACHRYAETWLDLHLMKEKNLSFKNFRPFRKIVTKLAMRIRLDDFFTDCFQNSLKAKKYTWGDNFDLQAQFHNGMTRQLFVDKITQNQTIGKILRKLDKVSGGKFKLFTSGFYDFSKEIPERLTAGTFVHPVTGKIIRKSIKDLEQETIKYSIKFIRAAENYIKTNDKDAFLKTVQNFNLDTGTVNGNPSDFIKTVTAEDYTSIVGKSKPISDHKKTPFNQPKAVREI